MKEGFTMTLKEKLAVLTDTEKESLFAKLAERPDINAAVAELASMDIQTTAEELKESFMSCDAKPVQGSDGELSDADLEAVSGGTEWHTQVFWEDPKGVEFMFPVGKEVEVASGWGFGTTVRCKITARAKAMVIGCNTDQPFFADSYYCEEVEYHWYFSNGWYTRDCIEK